MNYTTRKKTKYIGSILLISLIIIGTALYGVNKFEHAIAKNEKVISALHQSEIILNEVKYSFQLQINLFNNILKSRDERNDLADAVYSLKQRFQLTDDKLSELDKLIELEPIIFAKADEFKKENSIMLAKYLTMLDKFMQSGSDE